jgi:hypothetical protein
MPDSSLAPGLFRSTSLEYVLVNYSSFGGKTLSTYSEEYFKQTRHQDSVNRLLLTIYAW